MKRIFLGIVFAWFSFAFAFQIFSTAIGLFGFWQFGYQQGLELDWFEIALKAIGLAFKGFVIWWTGKKLGVKFLP